MKSINKLILPAIGAVFTSLNLNAAVIYDASLTNTGIVDNNANLTSQVLTGSTGALVLTVDQSGNNHAAGIGSNEDINTLKGSSLLATDTVTITLSVTSTTGNISANGIEFGMSPMAPVVGDNSDTSDFRPANNLIFQIDDAGADSGMAIDNFTGLGLNDAGWGVTEASLADGFTISLVANSSGFNFTLSDIVENGGTATTLSYGNSFTGSQFVDNFGGGHLYFTRQLQNTNSGVTNFGNVTIDVTPIPEPSTTALFGFSGFALLLRRRR